VYTPKETMPTSLETSFDALFEAGSRWVRSDLHLHTRADHQFQNLPEGVHFDEAYAARLKEEHISLGLITNHNKFDLDEFKRLRKVSRKNETLLLPGVELGVQGGSGGIHILICFEPEAWIDNKENNDFINSFLNTAFEQIPNRESEDTNCQWTLSQVLQKLNEHRKNGRDSFAIMAHVDDRKGLLKELRAGIESHFNDLFKESVLGFQKVRSKDSWHSLKSWTGDDDWKPAKVEGSDCKSLDTVGVAHRVGDTDKECWIKLGALSYESLKLALLMKNQRVADTAPICQSAYVRSMTLEGKLIQKKQIFLSSDMTNLIGIRGSGKSSLVECLRYALDLRLTELTDVAGYKESLVERTLGSGGKITLEIVDSHGDTYVVERVLRESPKVSRNGEYIPNLKPSSSSLINARYFGQKDLVLFSEENFAGELLKRFTVYDNAQEGPLFECRNQIEQLILQLQHGRTQLAQKEDIEAQLAEAKEVLKKFAEFNLGEKLEQQIALEKDLKHGTELVDNQEETIQSLTSWLDEEQSFWSGWMDYDSASKDKRFVQLNDSLKQFAKELGGVQPVLQKLQAAHKISVDQRNVLKEHYESQKESFAKIRRNLKLPRELSPDSFISISKKKSALEAKLKEIDSLQKKRETMLELLRRDLKALQDLWHAEFQAKQVEVDRLNACESSLQISLEFKGDKASFLVNLRDWTQGLQSKTLEKVVEHFADGIELYHDLSSKADQVTALGLNSDQISKLKEGIKANLVRVLNYKPEDSAKLEYKGQPLHKHSLGQRATALMMFLLSQNEYDLLIVDQPEDDLDNQTLYTEVIERLLQLKGKKQIVFATHSPNIPVLGDAEQILRCRYSPQAIDIHAGTIDSQTMQAEIIDVMEGGDDAFRKRKQIYESWKH
jgi:chromosome segregation protein